MNTFTLSHLLTNELVNLYNNYRGRIDNNNGNREHHYLSAANKQKISTAAKIIGGAIFFAPIVGPGIGNLVKDAGPEVTEQAINLLYYGRINKKLDNAGAVIDYVGDNPTVFFRKIADKVIETREAFLNNLPDDAKTLSRVTKYLAVNIMASIKHNAENKVKSLEVKIDDINNDLANTRSYKAVNSPSLQLKK